MPARTPHDSRRGILDPRAADSKFTLARHAPAAELASVVDRHWTIRWDLRARGPRTQETLPFPQVNLVFGTHRPGLHGVGTKRFVAELEGEGWVVGTKFRPGGFRPFWHEPISALTDRALTASEAFGEPGAALEAAVSAARGEAERIGLVEAFLRSRHVEVDDDTALAAGAVELVQRDPSITRVSELVARTGASVRKLQRVFDSHVGVSPSWVIRRLRVQEAAERVARGEVADWPSLALELGYFDQSHFIREFKAQIGRTPGEYAALCARQGGRAPSPGAPAPSS
ncbi:MAG: helix-turn-helix transcriptional regulator [Labilithrix sp.]|nr:helix-turn-helix transcriptional regulator [Labilithrix sp.]